MGKWEMVSFDDIFIDATKFGEKIPKESYCEEGLYPIIDQGKAYIAGYSNQNEGLYKSIPAIVFGDHTRVFKYVDFPFFLGADGVKLLKSKINSVDYKFLYYCLQIAHIPDTGYNRHFKWLKEIRIPLPPLPIQQKIADILDRASALIEKRKAQIEKLDLLVKSQFVEMFGDPVTNPMRWEVKLLGDIGSLKNGMNYSQHDTGYTIRCLGVGDFGHLYKIDDITNISKINLSTRPTADYLLKDGDIVFVRSNGNRELVGRSVEVFSRDEELTFSGFCIRYRNESSKLLTVYLNHALHLPSLRTTLLSGGRGANIQNVNQQMLASLMIPNPPLELQARFATFVRQVDKSKLEMQRGLDKLDFLYKSLTQKCFNGEVF